MKKVIPIVITIVVLVGVLGWYFMADHAVAPAQPSQNTPAPSEIVSETPTTMPEEKQSMLGSVKDAMGLGKRLACTYTDPTSGTKATVFVEGKKMKSTTTVSGVTVYGIFDGTTQYAWSSNAKTGTKMDTSCMNEMKNLTQKMQSANPPAPIENFESYQDLKNVSCIPAETESFSIPTDITFTDQCAVLRESMKAIEQMKDQIPSGMPMQL